MISDDIENWKSYLETPPNFAAERPPPIFPFGNNFPYDLIYDENDDDDYYYTDEYLMPSPSSSNPSSPSLQNFSQMKYNIQPTSFDSLDTLKRIEPVLFPPGINSINSIGEFENRTIIISNLPNNATKAEVESVFCSYGDIDNINLNDINRGIARIRYFDIRSSHWAKMTETKIRSNILFKSFAPLEEVTNPRKPPNNGTIVIFHLPSAITDIELSSIFSQFGEIRQIRSTPLKQNQKFVEFYDVRNAEIALKSMNGQFIKKSKVSIEFSLPGGFRKNSASFNKNVFFPTIERNRPKSTY